MLIFKLSIYQRILKKDNNNKIIR